MLNTLYWSFLALVIILLAWASLFSLIPFVFLSGGAALGLGYLLFLWNRRRRSGEWEHYKYQSRFAGSIFLFFALYWTTVGMFSNVREHREFWARYETRIVEGAARGYTFHYLDHKDCFENIDSAALNRYIEEKRPERVQLVLEVVKDFGRLRAYSVFSVEGIPVNAEWIGGTPPWEVLRGK